ncbi:MAG: hypothetical protein K9M82_11550 [Deltaproteobacteria bacterium]|nr:hypothetical protein [Deltaproteobacteria bacterium]
MLYHRNQITPFVLLFEGRAGSTFLIEHLDSHPQIRARKEILGPLRKDPPRAQLERTRNVLTRGLVSRYKAMGFKTKLRILTDPAGFSNLLHELDVKIIHLKRKNRVKEALSELLSNILKEKINDYNIYSSEERLDPIHVDYREFNWTLRLREDLDSKLNDYISTMKLPVLPIFYEDLLLGLDDQLKKIFQFIDVKNSKTKSGMVKHTNEDLRKVITNFDEIKKKYLNTDYEMMFDEVLFSN